MKRRNALLILSVIAYLAGLIWFAPASLASHMIGAWHGQQLALIEPSGTLWNGRGQLIVRAGQHRGALSLGYLDWRIDPARLLLLELGLQIRQNTGNTTGHAEIALAPGSITLRETDLSVPATMLAQLSPALSVLSPTGMLQLRTAQLRIKAGAVPGARGAASIDWNPAVLMDSIEAGSYRLELTADDNQIDGKLTTVRGDLSVQGEGSWSPNTSFRLNGRIRLNEGAQVARVQPLFRALCPRGGNDCAVSIKQ